MLPLAVERLSLEQLKIKRTHVQQELREVDLRLNLDPVLREDGRREIVPTSAADQKILDAMFKRHTKVSATWSGTRLTRVM